MTMYAAELTYYNSNSFGFEPVNNGFADLWKDTDTSNINELQPEGC